jgi:hypothetical protein
LRIFPWKITLVESFGKSEPCSSSILAFKSAIYRVNNTA